MAAFPTCHTCAVPAVSCATLAALKASIAGLGLTSVKHRCPSYSPAFSPGDAVKVETLAWFHRDDDDPPPKLDFPGHFIRLVGQRALVFVPPKAVDLNGEGIRFEPNGNGFLKVPLGRLAHRSAPPADVRMCRECGAEPGLGQPCALDPIYGRRSRCLAATLPAESGPSDLAAKPTTAAPATDDRNPTLRERGE